MLIQFSRRRFFVVVVVVEPRVNQVYRALVMLDFDFIIRDSTQEYS